MTKQTEIVRAKKSPDEGKTCFLQIAGLTILLFTNAFPLTITYQHRNILPILPESFTTPLVSRQKMLSRRRGHRIFCRTFTEHLSFADIHNIHSTWWKCRQGRTSTNYAWPAEQPWPWHTTPHCGGGSQSSIESMRLPAPHSWPLLLMVVPVVVSVTQSGPDFPAMILAISYHLYHCYIIEPVISELIKFQLDVSKLMHQP